MQTIAKNELKAISVVASRSFM